MNFVRWLTAVAYVIAALVPLHASDRKSRCEW